MTYPSAYFAAEGYIFAYKERDTSALYIGTPFIFHLLKRNYLIVILPSPYGLA